MKWLFHTQAQTKIIDRTQLRAVPERQPWHILYWLLYVCSVIAALWQHGNPRLVFILLATSVPMMGLAYLPYRYLPEMMRIWLALFWCGATGIWGIRQFQEGVMLDQVLIETVAAMAQLFLTGQRAKDYGFLFLSCLFMLIYGALLPREIFLWTLAGASLLLLWLLYGSRAQCLSGNPRLKTPPKTIRRNWHIFIIQWGLTGAFFWLIFQLIPMHEVSSEGFFGVSFLTDKDQALPQNLQKWLQPPKTVKSGTTGDKIIQSGSAPTVFNPQGTPMKIKNAQSKTASQDGDGSAMGQDLVFRVKSPVKLYHLGCLYDTYDGLKWKTTTRLQRQTDSRLVEPYPTTRREHIVELGYIVEKWNSPRLFAPYRPLSFSSGSPHVLIQSNTYSGSLRGTTYPDLPFRYTVSSKLYLPALANTTPVNLYIEKIPKKHYITLPQKKISKRLRNLVKEIIREAKTPYDQALALRDYLRTHCTYKLHSSPTPAGKEPVDYFIFELKTGHCEYFAAAMTVMARLAGLPARVATGYSPGNFNTLNNMFEVYEYHAHAWSQVFVENYGWLTLDAVPPGDVPSETKPLGIGKLRDPFGDEWRIVPPEATRQIQNFIKAAAELEAAPPQENSNVSNTQNLLAKAAIAEDRIRDTIQSLRARQTPSAKNVKTPQKFSARMRSWLQEICVNYPARHWRQLLPFPLMLLAVWLLFRMWGRARKIRHLRHIMNSSMTEAAHMLGKDNNATVRLTLRAMFAMLPLADLPRRKNQELLAFVRALPPAVCELLLPICQIYYRVEYRGAPVSQEEAEAALTVSIRLKELLAL